MGCTHKGLGMKSSRTYAKQRTCPPALRLLLYLSAPLSSDENAGRIRQHLRCCDFCGAEAALLSRFPVQTERVTAPKMPEPLRVLAEALLARHLPPMASLTIQNEHLGVLDPIH
jgi:hypothetical protein